MNWQYFCPNYSIENDKFAYKKEFAQVNVNGKIFGNHNLAA